MKSIITFLFIAALLAATWPMDAVGGVGVLTPPVEQTSLTSSQKTVYAGLETTTLSTNFISVLVNTDYIFVGRSTNEPASVVGWTIALFVAVIVTTVSVMGYKFKRNTFDVPPSVLTWPKKIKGSASSRGDFNVTWTKIQDFWSPCGGYYVNDLNGFGLTPLRVYGGPTNIEVYAWTITDKPLGGTTAFGVCHTIIHDKTNYPGPPLDTTGVTFPVPVYSRDADGGVITNFPNPGVICPVFSVEVHAGLASSASMAPSQVVDYNYLAGVLAGSYGVLSAGRQISSFNQSFAIDRRNLSFGTIPASTGVTIAYNNGEMTINNTSTDDPKVNTLYTALFEWPDTSAAAALDNVPAGGPSVDDPAATYFIPALSIPTNSNVRYVWERAPSPEGPWVQYGDITFRTATNQVKMDVINLGFDDPAPWPNCFFRTHVLGP